VGRRCFGRTRRLLNHVGPEDERAEPDDPNGLHEIPTDVPDTTLAHAVWAPSDSIIFDSERFGPRHLLRVGTDGNGLVQLTSGDASQDSAAVSPDGSMIVYGVSNPTQDLGLHIANADGTHVLALTKAAGVGARGGDDEPSFSPDGAWVVFERAVDPDAGKAALWVIHTDGTGLRRLTNDATDAGHARWSPDGKRILFTGHNDATTFTPGPLWIVDIAGGAPTPLTDPKNPGWSFEGDWSPDGRQIVFRYFLPASLQLELRVVDADGTHSSTLWVGDAETPDWGP
jgi:Tol biopolymer transport system component